MRGARQHDEKDTLAVAPWYWRDWRASKARAFLLSTKNWLGYVCYRELLDAHWGEQDCTLPGDDGELAALAGVTLEEWLSVKDVLVRWLSETSDGRRRNPRTFREWQNAKKNRTTARKKARKAAKALWDKRKESGEKPRLEHAPSIPQACPPTPTPSPSPTPTPSITDRTDSVAVAPVAWNREACDVWNERYGHGTAPGGRIGAALKPLVKAYGWPEVKASFRRYLAETTHPSPSPQDFASHYATWRDGDMDLPHRPVLSKSEERTKAAVAAFLAKGGQ